MAKEQFVSRTFRPATLAIIDAANTIIAEYQRDGFVLTLRQLYYQFVSRALIENKQTEYDRLGSIINDGRLAGLIDWSAIEDRTRNVRRVTTWDDPADIIDAVAKQYKEDLWADQEYRPEVWIEKDALIGVIEPVCARWRLPYFACRGYSSQSEQYRAGKRFAALHENEQLPLVLHLGDHDPSGIDMTRDNADRLAMFAGDEVEVRRLALNMDQVQRYRPPPNPAKESDGRAVGYIERFGRQSWELDALDPHVIDRLIEDEVKSILDRAAWARAKLHEDDKRKTLARASEKWKSVEAFLKKGNDDGV
jgi:hypothetical protein